MAYWAYGYLLDLTPPTRRSRRRVWAKQVVHCIWGSLPFRPLPPRRGTRRWEQAKKRWLAWNDGTVVKIAQGIYQERAFDRLPILHDALLDAGCDDEDILAHCKSAGPHVLGCWVIDLILAKE